MKRPVIFTEDFATKKKGDTEKYDPMLANQLVNVDKVAEYTDVVKKEKPAKAGNKK